MDFDLSSLFLSLGVPCLTYAVRQRFLSAATSGTVEPKSSMSTQKREIKAICVYCGASMGSKPEYAAVAQRLGEELAKRGIKLVYGGGSVGLMGVLARAVDDNGGEVYGVIPKVRCR